MSPQEICALPYMATWPSNLPHMGHKPPAQQGNKIADSRQHRTTAVAHINRRAGCTPADLPWFSETSVGEIHNSCCTRSKKAFRGKVFYVFKCSLTVIVHALLSVKPDLVQLNASAEARYGYLSQRWISTVDVSENQCYEQ